MRNSPLPIHFRQKIPQGKTFFELTQTLADLKLNTVCEEAKCPNRTECYSRGTLTLQILGSICTRRCGFCAETTGIPGRIDRDEPERILEAVRRLKLSHVVLTAPARDDLADGGASVFAKTVTTLKCNLPHVTVEVLVSDLNGSEESLKTVLEARPDVFNHNMETVRRLTPNVRAKATYDRSLSNLKAAADFFAQPFYAAGGRPPKVKSGVMAGLGETIEELSQTFADMSAHGVQYLTVGQYLQPSDKHLPVEKFYSMDEFGQIKDAAEKFPFEQIFCGPLIRSSYHADEMIRDIA